MFLSHNCRAFLLVLLPVSMFIIPHNSQPTYNYHTCYDPLKNSDYVVFQSNLTSLLDSLSSKAAFYGFYNDTSSILYGLFLCRGDVSSETCQNCTRTASQEIRTQCAYNTSAIIWYDQCMLRYSKDSFFGEAQTVPRLLMWNVNNRTSENQIDVDALAMIYPMIRDASKTDMLFKTGDSPGADGSQHRYGLVQCTRDIDRSSCSSCLSQLMEEAQRCCQQKVGWRILGPSCNVRYESDIFYQQALAPEAQQPAPHKDFTSITRTKRMAGVVFTIVIPTIVLAALLGFVYCSCSRWKRRSREGETSEEILLKNLESSTRSRFKEQGMNSTDEDNSDVHYFSLRTIKDATNDFSDETKLGEGGFGPVFKGKLINGKEIAVKRLSFKSRQGLEEFKNEVMLIAKLQHKNLVRLLGCCLEENEMLLVYEYMANTSLDTFLFGLLSSPPLIICISMFYCH